MAEHTPSHDRTDAAGDTADRRLTAVIVYHENDPDECTLFPADAGEDELVSTWISARQGSFVSLSSMC